MDNIGPFHLGSCCLRDSVRITDRLAFLGLRPGHLSRYEWFQFKNPRRLSRCVSEIFLDSNYGGWAFNTQQFLLVKFRELASPSLSIWQSSLSVPR